MSDKQPSDFALAKAREALHRDPDAPPHALTTVIALAIDEAVREAVAAQRERDARMAESLPPLTRIIEGSCKHEPAWVQNRSALGHAKDIAARIRAGEGEK